MFTDQNNADNRFEFFLRNFEQLHVKPSISLKITDCDSFSQEDWSILFQLMNKLFIKKLLINEKLRDTKPLFSVNDKVSNRPEISFRFNTEPATWLNLCNDKLDTCLQHLIFCTSEYNVVQDAWGQPVYKFHGRKPEIVQPEIVRKTLRAKLSDPKNILAVYSYTHKSEGIDLQEVTELLNPNTGWIRISTEFLPNAQFIVLRHGLFFNDNGLHLAFDYFNSDSVARYTEQFDQRIAQDDDSKNSLTLNFDEIIPTNSDIPLRFFASSILQKTELANEGRLHKEYAKSCLTGEQSLAYKIHHYKMNKQFVSDFIANRSLFKGRNVDIECNISNSNFRLFESSGNFICNIDWAGFLLDTPYYIESMIKLKAAASKRDTMIKSGPTVSAYDLLNTNLSFEDKKYLIELLFINGVREFLFNYSGSHTEQIKRLLEASANSDQGLKGYLQWSAYIHQLGHFLSSGISRPDVLVLYPEFEMNTKVLQTVYQQLMKKGIDFDFVDYDSFSNDQLCSFQEGIVNYNHRAFKLILLPGIQNIPVTVLKKLLKIFQSGGILIAIGSLPETSLESDQQAELNRLNKKLWLQQSDLSSTMFRHNESGGLSYFQPRSNHISSVIDELSGHLKVRIKSEHNSIVHTFRETNENYHLFLLNTSSDQRVSFRVDTTYLGRPYLWNFYIGESEAYPNWYIDDNRLYIKKSLYPKESCLFIIDKKQSTRIWQVKESSLDGCEIEKQTGNEIAITGWKREEGKYKIHIAKGKTEESLSYEVKNQLPILALSQQGWYLECSRFKGNMQLQDLSKLYPNLSEAVTYHKVIIIQDTYLKNKKLFLELGDIKHWCSISINEKLAGQRITPPWRFNITPFVQKGENKITIRVMNNLSNELSVNSKNNSINYPVQKFGLLGPVKIIPYSTVQLKI